MLKMKKHLVASIKSCIFAVGKPGRHDSTTSCGYQRYMNKKAAPLRTAQQTKKTEIRL
jgi:hypothetical protein